MSSLSRRVCTHALTVMALSLPATPAVAQQSEADLKAISAYTLTLPKYKQYLDAMVNLATVASQNPGIGEGMKSSDDESIASQIKELESHPQFRGAITATGLTPKDYVLTQWAMLQTGMVYAMSRGSGASQEELAKKSGVSKANLEFYAQNEAEITRLAKDAEARAPKVPDDDGEDADEEDDEMGDDAEGEAAE